MRLIFLAALLFPSGVFAQQCAPRDAVNAALSKNYEETPIAIALGDGGQLVEIYANLETGTWTFTATTPAGVTCMLASGESFQPIAQPLPGENG